ncbi:hypothetical protein QL992_09690 [Microbacterium sp. APC 3898]|uniref:Uncharacterized protein n=1 Tax=Planococcus notacanthi TaxID=3035188 RepID=A0ABT7ZJ74_9BACL|nr:MULTISPECIES: hypothetical protein [Terrabacteria group]MDN3427207.1 hypothetical protein [Planococcus sp. APC 4016]MDN3499488.1 hypothetical protein [Microbacterium sp. APC 3898]
MHTKKAIVHFDGRFPRARPQPVAPSSPRAVPAGVAVSISIRQKASA